MSSINIINQTDFKFDIRSLKQGIKIMLDYLAEDYAIDAGTISYCFMGRDEIRTLNQNFLEKESETDVLSFLDEEDRKNISGDVAICPMVVFEDAKEDGKPQNEYLAEILLHGSLHLFGLTHDYTEESLKRVYELHQHILDELSLDWSWFNAKSI